MSGFAPRKPPSRRGSLATCSETILEQIKELEGLYTINAAKLKEITARFVKELEKGLKDNTSTIPMNPSWVMSYPTGFETGTFLALDFGGTNLRVCEVVLTEEKGGFDIIQAKYKLPNELKTGNAGELWGYIADCIQLFVESHHEGQDFDKVPLGFTFSYPATQNYIDHGVLQRWTKGFDIDGVEGKDVIPPFEAALAKRSLPIKCNALINDTVGALVASAYTDDSVRIGCIFGTGCNAAYYENCGSIPKLAHMNLPPDMPMAINCEYGAFDNEHAVLPLTPYDEIIDRDSPRPGQQAYEKMIAGLYLGELFRLTLLDLHEKKCNLFGGQDISALQKPYSLDSSFLSRIEEDPFENLSETDDLLVTTLNIKATKEELELCRRLAELIGTRAARLSSCGVAAICIKKNIQSCHVGADGSVFNKYPHFKARGAQALREILDWPKGTKDPISIIAAEDGSGAGAAIIAALTLKRVQDGNFVGIKHKEHYE